MQSRLAVLKRVIYGFESRIRDNRQEDAHHQTYHHEQNPPDTTKNQTGILVKRLGLVIIQKASPICGYRHYNDTSLSSGLFQW